MNDFLNRPHDHLRAPRESRHRTQLISPRHHHWGDRAVTLMLMFVAGYIVSLFVN